MTTAIRLIMSSDTTSEPPRRYCSSMRLTVMSEGKADRRLDWMCVDLRRDDETEAHADYFFSCSVSDKDPRFKSRWMVVGHNVGLLRIHKTTGETELLYPMPEDEGNRRYLSAASTIRKHWQTGKLPAVAMFACG